MSTNDDNLNCEFATMGDPVEGFSSNNVPNVDAEVK